MMVRPKRRDEGPRVQKQKVHNANQPAATLVNSPNMQTKRRAPTRTHCFALAARYQPRSRDHDHRYLDNGMSLYPGWDSDPHTLAAAPTQTWRAGRIRFGLNRR